MTMQPADIVQLFEQRRRDRGYQIDRMLSVQRMYDGDILVPLPELDANEKPAVANLLIQGVDQLAMRLSGRLPDVDFPSAKAGDTEADKLAADARKAVLSWWDQTQLQKKLGRRCRFLVGYGSAPVMIKPVAVGGHDQRRIPQWHVLNPLATYPCASGDPDDIEPHDVIVLRKQTLAWLRDKYPVQANLLYRGPSATPDMMFDVLEYNDEHETVLVVVGARKGEREYADPANGTSPCQLLERVPNRAGVCLAVVPGRISMSRLSGHFDGIVGMFMAQAKLSAYELISIRRNIFPELWAVTHPGSPGQARIITVADGRQGTIGEIENGTILPINPQPGVQTTQAIDRLERAARVQASIPSDWGGESATNIRTAKRGEQVSSSASDPTLGELQNVLAESIEKEDERAIALSKAMWGNRMFSFYMPRSGETISRDYRPNEVFRQSFHFVKYSMPGIDSAGIPIEIGQRTQSGEMSQYTGRRLDPMIENPDFEDRQVEIEAVRHAALTGLEQQAGNPQGGVDPHELATVIQLLLDGKRIEDALIEAHQQLQEQQAAAAQSQPGAAEAQPGLAAGPPPAAPPPGGGGPPPLAQLLAGLRQPTAQSAAEQQLAPSPAMAGAGQ